jgi:tetratricopeptide (TPR) repeat protein
METHLSHFALDRIFSGQAADPEVDTAAAHLADCLPCLHLAARVVAELRRAGRLVELPGARGGILALFAAREGKALSLLLARAGWAELKSLSSEEQIERITTETSLQTQEMFDMLIEEASSLASIDPYLGEETALVAYALCDNLPRNKYPRELRNDLRGEAMGWAANCRRLAADWRGSAEAFKAAQKDLEKGIGDPVREARLLSFQASLATDTGHLEQAGALLARAAVNYHKAGDRAALASAAVQEAGTLLAACHHEEAVARAEEALRMLEPGNVRLELLARNVITASLVFLGHPWAALKSHLATRPLCEQFRDGRTELQAGYLEALLLDALGHAREAEKAFRAVIAGFLEAELYKDAFLIILTRFELLFRRGELTKAAEACEEALTMLKQAGAACHSQMEELWRSLRALVVARRLTEHQLLAARLYLVRHWHVPAHHLSLELAAEGTDASTLPRLGQPATENQGAQPFPAGAPAPATALAVEDYASALERYDRALIEVGLAQCGGRIGETSRLLDLSPNTLRTRIARYGLTVRAREDTSDVEEADLDWLRDEDRKALGWLRARAWWAEIEPLSPVVQLTRIKSIQALQTKELFDTILEDASGATLSDPQRGEEKASVAYTLAGLLSPSRLREPDKNDLQGAALGFAANCRRLAGDWRVAATAFSAAQRHLDRGTGDPARQARLLSLQASLATDMGHYDNALALLARISAIYRNIPDPAQEAFTAVQEAGTLLAAGRHAEAIARAQEALTMLTPRQARLESLARNIITSSLVFLGRPVEALQSLHATRPLVKQFRGRWSDTQLEYLEALVLDALGFEREAETVFRSIIEGLLGAGLYKDAFLILLTRFELLYKRGELDKAARACEEAIERMEEAGEERHAQTIQLWRDLLALVDGQRVTEHHLLETRHALVRCWAMPTRGLPLPGEQPGPAPVSRQDRRAHVPQPPPVPTRLAAGDYEKALARYEHRLIAAALAQCKGRILETCRLLGISRTTLRDRMSRYRLKG